MPARDLIKLVRTGGQTGVDQGAWDAAIACGLPHGGAIPNGYRTEAGILPKRYWCPAVAPMPWVPKSGVGYAPRTLKNIRAAHGVLLFSRGATPGTDLTRRLVPQTSCCYEVRWAGRDLDDTVALEGCIAGIVGWIRDIATFNKAPLDLMVAGPRESKAPGIQAAVAHVLGTVFLALEG